MQNITSRYFKPVTTKCCTIIHYHICTIKYIHIQLSILIQYLNTSPTELNHRTRESRHTKSTFDHEVLRPNNIYIYDRERTPFTTPAECRTPIKHDDNLRPEGPFEGRPKDDFLPKTAERPKVKDEPQDNLRLEGPFEGRPKNDLTKPVKGERADVRRTVDNLKPEGPFKARPKDDFAPKIAERPKSVRKPRDNLYPEGEFEVPKKAAAGPAERRTPIKHPDNLKCCAPTILYSCYIILYYIILYFLFLC